MLDLKEKLIAVVNSASNVKATLRWLPRKNSELWKEILANTSFLSETSSAPQRVWHIINDVSVVPTCDMTGRPLRWNYYEKGYKKYPDKKIRYEKIGDSIKQTVATKGHWRKNDRKKAERANEKYSIGYRNGNHKPLNERNRDHAAASEAAKKTCMEKYGVDNPAKHPSVKQKIAIKAKEWQSIGIDRTMYEEYYNAVKLVTKRNWYEHFYVINPDALQRGNEIHLDHIYSIHTGFKNNIPPEIIGHWTNLRMLSKKENSSKGKNCHKKTEQLYEDYNVAMARIIYENQ